MFANLLAVFACHTDVGILRKESEHILQLSDQAGSILYAADSGKFEDYGSQLPASGLLTETVTILYENSYAIQNPQPVTADRWEFTEGNITTKYSDSGIHIAQNSTRKKDHEAIWKDNLWSFDGKKPEGTGRRYANESSSADAIKTMTKEQREQEWKRNIWNFNGKSVEGTGRQSAVKDEASTPKSRKEAEEMAKKNTWHFGSSKEEYQGRGPRYAMELSQFMPQKVN